MVKNRISGFALAAFCLTVAACSLSLSYRLGNTSDTPGRKEFGAPPPKNGEKTDWTALPESRQ